MHRFTLFVVFAAALAAGCAGSVGYSASVSSGSYGPDLVYAAPGVQVIADYDEPIFYADSFYWRFDGGRWYRSSYYTGGWAYASPPALLLRIEQPRAYVHYRPQGWVARRGPERGPAVRDHREPVHDRSRDEHRQQPPQREAPRKDHRHDDDRDHRK